MKIFFTTIFTLVFLLTGYTQGNHVFSGGELVNYSVMDIATGGGQTWATERTALPGYFSAVNTANYTGCTDASHINGYIKKYGNTAFTFPVGTGSDLRTLEISAPTDVTDAYATAWIAGDPTSSIDPTAPNQGYHSVFATAAPIVSVSKAGQWDWQVGAADNLGTGTTGTGAGINITVSIPDMTTFAAASSLRLVGWNGSQWIDLSGIATASGNTENSTLKGTMVEGITAIAIGSISWALPLKIESLNTVASNCDAVINWRTSNEVNTDKFIIEQSFDGAAFSAIATVKAKGGTLNTYTHTVAQSAAFAYYRLKMFNTNGTYTYSPVTTCKTNCSVKETMTVYPNPVVAGGTVNLSFETAYRGTALLMINNMLGQVILRIQVQISNNTNLIPINVGRFAAATYMINLLGDRGERIGSVQKFIKQ